MARVWVLGTGAREHALGWRLLQDGASEVVFSPGNGGTTAVGRNHPCDVGDEVAVLEAAKEIRPDLVVVGPEAPLVDGLVDALVGAGYRVFGPGKAAASLEGSKVDSKAFMDRHGIPTAISESFDELGAAVAFVQQTNRPWVVKADGLAAGKGVVVASTVQETLEALHSMMGERKHGNAGARVLLEEHLDGEEVSYHVLCDGTNHVALPSAQDHKRIFEGDRGPNTGGMGAYTPAPALTDGIRFQVEREIIMPTLDGLREEGRPFRGVLFVGLMVSGGQAKVLEYNVRFGDPECACLMMGVEGNMLELLTSCAAGDLRVRELDSKPTMAVVMASNGYPESSTKGVKLGIPAELPGGVNVFHAGTRLDDGELVTAGGRVLTVTAVGGSLQQARDLAYGVVERVDFPGAQVRGDIGWRAL